MIPERDAKSIGSESTLDVDIVGEAAIRPWLLRSADTVARRLRVEGLNARGVRVKLRTADFRLHTRQTVLVAATRATRPIVEAAQVLLHEFDLRAPVRLVGVAAFDLREGGDVPAKSTSSTCSTPRARTTTGGSTGPSTWCTSASAKRALVRARHLDRGAGHGH